MGKRTDGRAPRPWQRTTLRALTLAAAYAVVLSGCGGETYEPKSLSDLPPSDAASSGGPQSDDGSATRPPRTAPSSTPAEDETSPDGPTPATPPTPTTAVASTQAIPPPTPTATSPSAPPNQPPDRKLLVDCATIRLRIPDAWDGTGDTGTWTFTPNGNGHGELTVRGSSEQVSEPPSRADLERLAGGKQRASTKVRSDGGILGVGNVDGAPTWRIAVGAPDRTQLITLTYAAAEGSVPIDAVFDADVQQLHTSAATLRVEQVGACPGIN